MRLTRLPLCLTLAGFAAASPCAFAQEAAPPADAPPADAPPAEAPPADAPPADAPPADDAGAATTGPFVPTEFRLELGAFGGVHFFEPEHGLGRAEDDPTGMAPSTSGAFGLRLTFNLNRWVAFEGEGLAMPTRTRDDAAMLWVFGYRASLLAYLMPPGRVRPFVVAGFGGLSSISDDDDVVRGDVDGTIHAGLGAKIAITDRFGLRIDGRVLVPPAILGEALPVGDETGFSGPDFEILAGLYVGLGAPATKVVVEKEVVQLPPPPNPDPDGDGIAGEVDRCPMVAEDKDGFEDDDGCPDADNDKDGVPDGADKCALEPEDKDGFEDTDGCPETDNDKDGILDAADKCPNDPETKNNFQDGDGCPDEVPADVKKFTGVIQGINFKTNSDKLLKNSFPLLNRAVAVLQQYPDVRLEISGHTDNKGKPDYNRDLSQKRADAVKAYFVSKGIDAGRLEAVGYGMDRPLASNKTAAGRSKNRRTEFTLLGAPGERPGQTPAAPAAPATPGAGAPAPAAPARAPAAPAPAAPAPAPAAPAAPQP